MSQMRPSTRDEMPPMGVEVQRAPSREPSRQAARGRPVPEPHEIYALDDSELLPGMDHFWVPTRAGAGMPNPDLPSYYEAGWEPAAAKDFPRLSGYGREYPQAMINAGIIANVQANDAIIKKDLMLVVRPKELSIRAHQAREANARSQVADQYAHLQRVYRSRDGGPGIKTSYGRLPGMAPGTDEE